MTSLVTCSGCGKKFSRKAPKCPNCGGKYRICHLCKVLIASNEKILVLKGGKFRSNYQDRHVVTLGGSEIKGFRKDGRSIENLEHCVAYIHFSCLEPYFISPKHVKCPDCGLSINCQIFSLEDFINSESHPEMFEINCSNCGNPDVLEFNTLKGYSKVCDVCELLIIPAIHNFKSYGPTNSDYSHSFCTYEAIAWRHKRKVKGKPWFGTFFSEPDPGKNKEC